MENNSAPLNDRNILLNKRRPVRALSVDVARKIAAGEVIDRPAAIVRELLDNAVDSGADTISVELCGGGIEKIRVSDNGWGMTKEDLSACARPHCTSKISDSEDLLNLTTLGFRGEALASIAAVSRLSIMSGNCKMRASITEDHIIETIPPVQDGKGTIVMSEGLFENFPARRHFLKRPASENMMCREVFIEKSLPRPDIAFRLTIDGVIRHDLPGSVTLAERFTRALELKENSKLFSEISSRGKEADGESEWSLSIVIGEPGVYRNDRKNIYIFVNGRRVQEYSLIQAIEYGCQGFFPNGTHPVAALFLTVSPKVVDFNIHPAKKEIRFKDISSVHHGVSAAVRNHFRNFGIKSDFEKKEEFSEEIKQNERNSLFQAIVDNELSREQKESHSKTAVYIPPKTENYSRVADYSSRLADYALSDSEKQHEEISIPKVSESFAKNHIRFQTQEEMRFSIPGYSPSMHKEADFVYYGTLFGTFLMVQKNGVFYLIDQHAAHERILFNKLMEGGSETQNLLIPYEIETESKEEDEYLSKIQFTLSSAGFKCEKKEEGKWIFTALPAKYKGTARDLRDAIFEKKVNPEEIIYQIAAMSACKAAVKDGTLLGAEEAEKLAKEALELKDPHCPHGRPVWTTLTKEELFNRVRRTR